MSKKDKKKSGSHQVQLPKDAITRVNLGQAFAEYDQILMKPGIFVKTPAIMSAADPLLSKCFFVGRRGTGKTAVTYFLSETRQNTIRIHPQVLSPLLFPLEPKSLLDSRQRPFRSLMAAFKRALLDEVLSEWINRNLVKTEKLPQTLIRELRFATGLDFDFRILHFLEKICSPLKENEEENWLHEIGLPKKVGRAMMEVGVGTSMNFTLMIDRIDDSWDGSDTAVIMLMALMHACIELLSSVDCVRPLVFLRENVFDRVRQIDNEASRLETCVVSMEWTTELLMEMIERRLSLPFITKLPIGGLTWKRFFESTEKTSAESLIFDYCQKRPRDVLTYCSFAIEMAQSKRHEIVTIDDIIQARRRFSETRLKDLGDEYAENYPRISLVLDRFYGLGREFTLPGIDAFIKKLIADDQIKMHCSSWIYNYTQPEKFVRLLYNIGFFGIKTKKDTMFRPLGPSASNPPAIMPETHIVIHNSYTNALDLRDAVVGDLDENVPWQSAGLIGDLPDSVNLGDYTSKLTDLMEQLKTIPEGIDHYSEWEDTVGEVIKFCFYRWLTNVIPKVRDVSGCVVRDWVASNRAEGGFWEMIRIRYKATQVVWECKNYKDLTADDFQQATYYLNDSIGLFVVIAFRGFIKKHYYEHIKRISHQYKGLVLLLTNKDLQVFVRQAVKGKVSENHIQNIYDTTVREIS